MRMLDVEHGNVPGVSIDFYIDRWRLRLLSWHCATLYRFDMVVPDDPCDHTTFWWLYVSPFDNTGIGVHLPVWLSKRLGLSRNYTKSEVSKATNT